MPSSSNITSISLVGLSAVIHLLPLPGVLGNSALERLYGFRIKDNKNDCDADSEQKEASLLLALQHRAVMLGSLGAALWAGVFVHRPSLPLAVGMTVVSDVSFLALALPRWKKLGSKIRKVVYADVLSVACLFLGGFQLREK